MSDFWEFIKKEAASLEHKRNVVGKTRSKCKNCAGTGISEPGYDSYDSYGSTYVSPVHCRHCGGYGSVEVPCSPEVHIKALQTEIKVLQSKVKEIKKNASSKSRTT